MGSEADDAEAAAAGAIDSDGSVSWEEFFGTSTDLVPQLLGMFDELVRRGECCSYDDRHQVVLQSEGNCNIPVAIQKRLSLVPHSHRSSVFGKLCSSEQAMLVLTRSQPEVTMKSSERVEDDTTTEIEGTTTGDRLTNLLGSNITSSSKIELESREIETENEIASNDTPTAEVINEKSIYRRESSALTPLRYIRRGGDARGAGCRPLSASSIASSTSSSGCSNQGNAHATNPYLTSVESLADTCASSQGSGDSGVVTISEASCRIRDVDSNERRGSADGHSPIYHRPRYCDPHRNPVERVLMEIIDTEAIYVEHLRQVIQGYLIFWRDDPAGLVRQLQLNHLFSNIEDIFEFNREFLKEIEACGLNPVCVADTFIKHNAGFKVYTEYCTNYPRTVSVLTDLMGQEVMSNAFRERQTALGHALPLGSFLLKPVQRILKYHLLLENLSKEYGLGSEENGKEAAKGRTAIDGALEAMTGIAKHINAMKRRHEHAVRVQEIQSLLYGWTGPDLTTSGELVAEGRFRMRGAKAPRHAFLFERMLLLTKKKEDGLLVYKAHILCSNLMLIESIPGEPCSFHVIPFDNPRLQHTLQARNVEQKREWALQIKRVILENYNAVIPSHARQLVLELGQSQQDEDTSVDKGSIKKQYSAPPEYLEKRKQEKERRKSEAGLRQKLKKTAGKLDSTARASIEYSPLSERRKQQEDTTLQSSRDPSLNRSLDARTTKVKDRFTNWRRKSEPGFQSYVSLNQSDNEENPNIPNEESDTPELDCKSQLHADIDFKYTNEKLQQEQRQDQQQQDHQQEAQEKTQTVEQIVGHILMQNQEFQRLLEKQRNNSIINVRHQQRFNKHISAETSDESDTEHTNYSTETPVNNNNNNNNNNNCNSNNNNNNNNTNNKGNRTIRTNNSEQHLIRTNNAWNAFSSPQSRDFQPTLQLRYDNLRKENDKAQSNNNGTVRKMKLNRIDEKRRMFEAFKKQSITSDSKIIKTALRMRENSANEESNVGRIKSEKLSDELVAVKEVSKKSLENNTETMEKSKNYENYDNLQDVWDGMLEEKEDDKESPTRPAVWLNKLCESLPVSPQKSGSLPRSFQISPNAQASVTKARFLHRDGKPMSERPVTIASDKPGEINLEDMERYASTCKTEGRIAKFPTTSSSSSSTFFLTLDDNLTDAYSEIHAPVTSTNIHPDHKIYRSNISGSAIFKNVLSKAGSRLQVLRTTMSTETLESNEEFERTKDTRSLVNGKTKKKNRMRLSRETWSDIDDFSAVGCVPVCEPNLKVPAVYYKQGSSGLGARIAQSDYADPSFLFSEYKRAAELASSEPRIVKENDETSEDRRESETDSFYERSFETIENYLDSDGDDVFRDSAVFSDAEEIISARNTSDFNAQSIAINRKIAPPVPAKRNPRIPINTTQTIEKATPKPIIPRKPINLAVRPKIPSARNQDQLINPVVPTLNKISQLNFQVVNDSSTIIQNSSKIITDGANDVSAGQSQVGWVRKMVGQLQAHVDT